MEDTIRLYNIEAVFATEGTSCRRLLEIRKTTMSGPESNRATRRWAQPYYISTKSTNKMGAAQPQFISLEPLFMSMDLNTISVRIYSGKWHD